MLYRCFLLIPLSLFSASTPAGHAANDDLIAIGSSHRKIANPLPLGAMSFATTTLLLSLYNLGVQGVEVPNAAITMILFYGGLMQYFAGIWEYKSGNTLGATIFCSYALFWFGFSFLFIPFFGLVGSYDGVPNVYSSQGGIYAAQFSNAIGLYLWVWFGITTTFLFAAARSSITLIVL
jgi:succinate-acetate transporter protein